MFAELLAEPELEFGSGGRHIDIRHGLSHTGPLDIADPARRAISVGFVGTNESLERLHLWLDKCRSEIPGKEGAYPHLFPHFPGFNSDSSFRSTLVCDPRAKGVMVQRQIDAMVRKPSTAELVEEFVQLFLDELAALAEKNRPDVIICAPNERVWEAVNGGLAASSEKELSHQSSDALPDFHDLLKARAMRLRIPIQLIWPFTYDKSKRRSQVRRPQMLRGQQDEATRAWNIHTALYYKAGGIPWRLVRDSTQLATCSVGITFYETFGKESLFTSVAQVFNERGEGMVVRGGQASILKDDRQPHLDSESIYELVRSVLAAYRQEHKTLPARVVIHKSSRFSAAELDGCNAALDEASIAVCDLLSIQETPAKLFREGINSPLRGTFVDLGSEMSLLYTRGSVDFFRVYPGQYIASPLLIRHEQVESGHRAVASEILALSKMNWNSTQFDGRFPVTLRVARQVGSILRYVEEDQLIGSSYAFFM